MRIVTWNVNSLRARIERVEHWLSEVQPDVLCLQETKMADDAFPALTFEQLGYQSAHYGQGQWNGVAILSRVGLDDVVNNFAAGIDPDPDARIITATCGGVRVACCYVPNGRALDDDHYTYKLSWLDRLVGHLNSDTSPDDDVVVTGDFNIAPDDRDVHDPASMVGSTHVSGPERDRLAALERWGLVDLFRQCHPDAERVFSWWDYRGGSFHKGIGMRIDLVLGSRSVADRCAFSVVDRNARKGTSPSDHAPVVVDLA
ncbi:MAG: exodeoxyribonuclease III [Ilumatobacteraceae bacterium]